MIRNYLTVALRNLVRNRFYSILSLVGLAVNASARRTPRRACRPHGFPHRRRAGVGYEGVRPDPPDSPRYTTSARSVYQMRSCTSRAASPNEEHRVMDVVNALTAIYHRTGPDQILELSDPIDPRRDIKCEGGRLNPDEFLGRAASSIATTPTTT